MTMSTNPAENRVQAIFIKGHLKLIALGMKNSRISGTEMLKKAGAITGKTYKRGQYQQAINDLVSFINGAN